MLFPLNGIGKRYKVKSYGKSYITKVSLTIRNIKETDFGTYLCVAKNSLGESDGTIKLSGNYFQSVKTKLSYTTIKINTKKQTRTIAW